MPERSAPALADGATDKPKLVGGPLDGVRLSKKPRPPFIYVAAEGEEGARIRAFNEPAAGRELYRLIGREPMIGHPKRKIDVYVYAGHTHRRCDGCMAFTSTEPACAFCGHDLAASARS